MIMVSFLKQCVSSKGGPFCLNESWANKKVTLDSDEIHLLAPWQPKYYTIRALLKIPNIINL